MAKIRSFFKREPVFMISFLAAVISCFFVHPDAKYIDYLDFHTLALLYSLMVVVAGLRKAGVFTALARTLCLRAKSTRSIGLVLVGLCFFSPMFFTNDVALLTFVPFAIVVLGMTGRRQDLIRIIVLQTVAANLGSMLTPVGNSRSLYLYSFYNIPFFTFLSITFPVWLLSFIVLLAICLFTKRQPIIPYFEEDAEMNKKALWVYLILFGLCMLTVLRFLDWPIMLAIILIVLLIFQRKTILEADFMLLLTFVAFFVFAGNLARIDEVDHMLQSLLSGREYWVTILTSQLISNVPAALLLSNFTENMKALLLGVNIGSLGTPIASLASLISLKFYAQTEGADIGKFLLEFTIVNVGLLVLLSVFQAVVL